MPRSARQKSITGIYHIMLRGIDKRDIFLENEDKMKFLESINKAKETGKFELYGYCLMDNHIHMLIKESEEIGTSVKRITKRELFFMQILFFYIALMITVRYNKKRLTNSIVWET